MSSAAAAAASTAAAGGVENTGGGPPAEPLIHGVSYGGRDDLLSSIPRTVSGKESAVSTLGGGSANIAGGYYSTGPYAKDSPCSHLNIIEGRNQSIDEVEELPFAFNVDAPLASGTESLSPSSGVSRNLWGSTKADDVFAGTMMGTTSGGGVAELTSAMAVSSLHHRCATDVKIRLKMFDDNSTRGSAAATSTTVGDVARFLAPTTSSVTADSSTNFADNFADQLSDFRSFGASLMAESSE